MMVKSLKQAIRIQESRVRAGKRGVACAVRRFLIKEIKSVGFDVNKYLQLKRSLPQLPIMKIEEVEEAV